MRTFRNRTTVLAAAATAALALTLTACGDDGTGTRSAGPADVSRPATSPAQDAQDAAETASVQDTGAARTAGASKTADGATAVGAAEGAGGSSSSPSACTTGDLTVSAAAQDGPPYTHIVLTAKNTSGHSCRMEGFPEIRFLENARGIAPAVARSKPAAPVVLTAGAPAYALVKLSDGGMDEDVETVKDFSVTLQGNGGMAVVKAPGAEGIAVDPAKWATGYWTYELRNGADDF
ncbi:DUF4232 domain-containing protein [Streptomyces sp. B1I3]|uniref:DUF4232 domain-containing protein n=1 Tax=Streptomyces sp. B1I3 TaxID=3042264 RepID=UPI0027813E24|nr:DUF4232 domain-containing protein [Streptomyces sp. B1I3]MDQ0795327.1 hypothetical protein [Streptomyces sp. B1I3]